MDDFDSRKGEALIESAYRFANDGRHEEAIAVFSDLISRRPVNPLFHQRGLSYLALGDFINAIEDFTSAIQLDSSDSDSYFNRGNVYLRLKSYKSAVNDYNIAISLVPEDPRMFNSRGFALAKAGQLEDGFRDLMTAIRLDANYVSARYNIGILYFEAGKLNEALNHLDYATSLCPEDDAVVELRRKVKSALQRAT